jgi:hypothetical protein
MDFTDLTKPEMAKFAADLEELNSFFGEVKMLPDDGRLEKLKKYTNELLNHENYWRTGAHYMLLKRLKVGYLAQPLHDACKTERCCVEFFKTHLPCLPKTSLYRCLALAKKFPDPAKVPKDLTITDAYRLVGLLPAKETSAPKRASKEASAKSGVGKTPAFTLKSFRDDIGRVKGTLVTLLEANSKASFSPSDTTALIGEIAELTELLGKMRLRLSPPVSPQTRPLHCH